MVRDGKILRFERQGVTLNREDLRETQRSIRFPKYVWDALDNDAKRCRRSPVRQLESILIKYLELPEDIEISPAGIRRAQDATSLSSTRKRA